MVGDRVRFLFTSELLQAYSFACNNSLVNKNRTREPTMMLFIIILLYVEIILKVRIEHFDCLYGFFH